MSCSYDSPGTALGQAVALMTACLHLESVRRRRLSFRPMATSHAANTALEEEEDGLCSDHVLHWWQRCRACGAPGHWSCTGSHRAVFLPTKIGEAQPEVFWLLPGFRKEKMSETLSCAAESTLHAVTCHEKVVAVWKDHTESLGMTVAGGASNRDWDLPIYVISVEPGGVISRDSRIKTGDILLNVNGIDLTGVSRSEAVALLKNTNSSVVLKALEMRACEAREARGHLPAPEATQATAQSSEWSPSWVTWLGLPRYLYSCKEIVLRRNTSGSLGFSIVGGYEEHTGNKPFFIKSIVVGTPAYNDGRIRCGDILLAVNGRNTSGMMHACLARMLKELKGKITLTIVSWPGTFL